jgi:hypothetical protein
MPLMKDLFSANVWQKNFYPVYNKEVLEKEHKKTPLKKTVIKVDRNTKRDL